MESPAVPRKHIYDSERIKKLCRSSFVSPFPPHSRFLSNLWACYGSLIWASSKSAWPQRCDCGGGHYGSALGFRDDPGHGWHHKVSLPPHTHTHHTRVFQTPAPQRGGRAGRASSSTAVILLSAELLAAFKRTFSEAGTLQIKKKTFPNSN